MPVCLFDIDGTLLNSGGAGQVAMEAALESEFNVTAPTEGLSFAGRTDRAITEDLLDYHSVEQSAENLARFLDAYLSRLPNELVGRTGVILPGVEAVLESLHASGDMILGLLTGNLRRGAELKLSHYRLDHYFCCGGFGDHHRDRDDVARTAAEDVRREFGDSATDEIWVFGDTPADVQCGRAIGARVIAVATGHYSSEELAATEPDFLFDDFSDTGAVLSVLTGTQAL